MIEQSERSDGASVYAAKIKRNQKSFSRCQSKTVPVGI
jgi:hypothetical protein